MPRAPRFLALLSVPFLALRLAVAQEAPHRKVLIISVDGTRPDALQAASAPNLKGLLDGAAYSFRAQTAGGPEDLPISGPGYSSMLTGAWCAKHRVCDNDFTASRFDLYPIFFCRLRAARPEAVIESIVRWSPLSTNLITCADVDLAPANDAAAAQEGVRLLQETDPDVLFFHLEDVDTTGHSFGFSPESPEYLAAIETADGRVGDLLQALRARPTFPQEDWLIFALTDHGGSGKDHHARIPECMTIFFIAAGGAHVVPGEMDPPPRIVDLAPTAMTFLGLAIDGAWGLDGQPVGLAPVTPAPRQLPSDCNLDGKLNLADVVCVLNSLFSEASDPLPCGNQDPVGGALLVLDSNGDGGLDIADAIHLLFHIFAAGPPPAGGTECRTYEGCPDACPL